MQGLRVWRSGLVVLAVISGIVLWGSAHANPKAPVPDRTGIIQDLRVDRGPHTYEAIVQRHLALHRRLGQGLPGGSAAPRGGRGRLGSAGQQSGSDEPVPIPGGLFGGQFHVWVPGPTEIGAMGLDVEPNVITNFNGLAAIAYLVGVAHGSDGVDYDMMNDMRLYRGSYISVDGTRHRSTFAFV